MTPEIIALVVVVCAVVGAMAFAFGYFVNQYRSREDLKAAELDAEKVLSEAKTKEKELLLEAKDSAIKLKAQAEAEIRERRAEVQRQERRLQQKEENLERKIEALDRRDRMVAQKEKDTETIRQEIESLKKRQVQELERVAGLSRAEARDLLMQAIEEEVKADANRRVREIESEVKAEGDRRSRQVLAMAIQRCASDLVAETTVSVVPLPNDEMKGRIIGREGRNIRALESATGVDLIIDDTPDAVTLSAFDPIRREVARVALNKLILDGRIHPARIEEVVQKARSEVDAFLVEQGTLACSEAGIQGLHPDLVKMLGRLYFRTSYGQNMLSHSIEVAHLAAMIASELHADVAIARRAGLLHDIGKAIDHEMEGSHALIGMDVAKRLGVSPRVVHAIGGHHGELEDPLSVEAIIIQAADAISGARPGARRETVEHYIRRLEALESVANSFPGVDKSFAIQAGREVRIIVKPDEVDDLGSVRLARDIVKKIEETLEYPGQIRVTVVRETRAVDYAK